MTEAQRAEWLRIAAEVNEKAEKATPGPWCHFSNPGDDESQWWIDSQDGECPNIVCTQDRSPRGGHPNLASADDDLAFIVHARTAVPHLAEAVTTLIAEVERLRSYADEPQHPIAYGLAIAHWQSEARFATAERAAALTRAEKAEAELDELRARLSELVTEARSVRNALTSSAPGSPMPPLSAINLAVGLDDAIDAAIAPVAVPKHLPGCGHTRGMCAFGCPLEPPNQTIPDGPMPLELCNHDGLIDLGILNRLKTLAGEPRWEGPRFQCTGTAYIGRGVYRCTSLAHTKPPAYATAVAPPVTAAPHRGEAEDQLVMDVEDCVVDAIAAWLEARADDAALLGSDSRATRLRDAKSIRAGAWRRAKGKEGGNG